MSGLTCDRSTGVNEFTVRLTVAGTTVTFPPAVTVGAKVVRARLALSGVTVILATIAGANVVNDNEAMGGSIRRRRLGANPVRVRLCVPGVTVDRN